MGVRKPEWVLICAVLLSTPMIPGILNGDIGASNALLRFLGALLLCWAAGWVLSVVVDRYAESARRAEILSTLESAIQQRDQASRTDGTTPNQPDGSGVGMPDRVNGGFGSGQTDGAPWRGDRSG